MSLNPCDRIMELHESYIEMKEVVEVDLESTDIYFELKDLLQGNLGNIDVVVKCMLYFPELYKSLPYDLKCIEEVAVEALAFHRPNFLFLPEELKATQSFRTELFFKSPSGYQLDYDFIAGDEVLVERLLEKIVESEYYFKYAPAMLVADRRFCMKALKKNGMVLHFLPLEFREDEELTRIALSECGIALKYAHPKFQSDLKMVLIAVDQNLSSIRYADPSVLVAKELEFIWVLPEWKLFKEKELRFMEEGYNRN